MKKKIKLDKKLQGVGTFREFIEARFDSKIDIKDFSKEMLASFIDHTLLKADADKNDIIKLCQEAIVHGFYSVCVNPYWVRFAGAELRKDAVKICTVIGFPLGANEKKTKVFEAKNAIKEGADELDMVINISQAKNNNFQAITKEINSVAKQCKDSGVILKIIIETCLLDEKQIYQVAAIARSCGADFVKTSTGYSLAGATEENVAVLRKAVGNQCGVKASGGIRDKNKMVSMLLAGASRIGTSSGIQIISRNA